MSNNTLRILTALVGIPAIVLLLYVGSWPFAILILVIALLSQYETYRLLEAAGLPAYKGVGLGIGALLVIAPLVEEALLVAVGALVVGLALLPFLSSSDNGGSSSAGIAGLPATIFGVIYPTALLGFLVALRAARGPAIDDRAAFFLVLTVFLVVWSTDTFAYYVGRAVGRRPLAPTISPKKTWAGAVGGTVGAVLVAIILKLTVLDFLPWVHVLGVAVIGGVVGQLGDLAESRIKRLVGVKDSGTLLPGHGGMLDRFDAMVLAAPAVYLYLHFAAGVFDGGL